MQDGRIYSNRITPTYLMYNLNYFIIDFFLYFHKDVIHNFKSYRPTLIVAIFAQQNIVFSQYRCFRFVYRPILRYVELII